MMQIQLASTKWILWYVFHMQSKHLAHVACSTFSYSTQMIKKLIKNTQNLHDAIINLWKHKAHLVLKYILND